MLSEPEGQILDQPSAQFEFDELCALLACALEGDLDSLAEGLEQCRLFQHPRVFCDFREDVIEALRRGSRQTALNWFKLIVCTSCAGIDQGQSVCQGHDDPARSEEGERGGLMEDGDEERSALGWSVDGESAELGPDDKDGDRSATLGWSDPDEEDQAAPPSVAAICACLLQGAVMVAGAIWFLTHH